MTNDADLGRDVLEDDDEGPVDPDILLITSFLTGDLSAEEDAAVEARLVADETFWEKVAPIIKIWNLPVNWRELVASVEAEERRAAEAEAAAKAAGAGAESKADVQAEPRNAPVRQAEPSGTPQPFEYPWEDPPKRVREPTPSDIERLLDRARWEPAVDKGKLPLEHRGVWAYLPFSPKQLGLAAAVAVITFGGYRYGKNVGMKDSFPALVARKAQIDAKVAAMNPTAVPVVVRAGESTYVLGRIGSKVVRAVVEKDSTITAVLEGEAYYDVRKETKKVVVNVGHVVIDLAPGTYAIRCETGSDQVLITVGQGSATIRQYNPKATLTLQGGEHGRAIKGMSPERTRGGEGYPALEPPSAIAP